jgi:hypothetical protein
MSGVPDEIVLSRDRDLAGRDRELWIRRVLFAFAPLIAILAIFNAFGQRPQDITVTTSVATLRLHAPERVRSGLLYQARFTIDATRRLRNATLVLAPGWFEGMTANTIEPSPEAERSVNGETLFELGPIAPGGSHVLYMQFQINPTNVGRRSQAVRLLDGTRPILTMSRTITVFP